MKSIGHLMASVLLAVLTTTPSGAFAFHPGETHSGAVPQGPDCIACNNQGRQGIDIAITAGGTVHCEDVGDDDEGGDGGDGGDNVE